MSLTPQVTLNMFGVGIKKISNLKKSLVAWETWEDISL